MAKKNTSQETKTVAPVVAAPVVAEPVAAPVKATKSKKVAATPAPVATPVVAAPVVAAPTPAPVVATPTKRTKKVAQPVAETPAQPVAETPAPAPAPVQTAGTSKPRKPAAKPKTPRQAKAKTADAAPKKGGKKVAAPVQAETPVVEGEERGRFFKYSYNGTVSGRFSGSKPKQAANKALTSIVKSRSESGEDLTNKLLTFSIIECTRGSKKKEYQYQGVRRALDKPIEVRIKDKNIPIVYRFQNKTSKLKAQQSAVASA